MNFFNDYFVFSSSERKGILLFVLILIGMTLLYIVMPYFKSTHSEDFSEIKERIAQWENKKEEKNKLGERFEFNPNLISRDSLLILGLTAKQSFNVINYREKVGHFKTKRDFKKLYSIGDSLYRELMPFIQLKREKNQEVIRIKEEVREDSLFNFDPNTSSLEELKRLGFSDKQSKILDNFRTKGGEFYKKEDLKKVYTVTEELYKKLEPYIAIEEPSLLVRKNIEINSAKPHEIERLLGLSRKSSYVLVKYRDRLGGFYSVDQLYEVFGIDSAVIDDNINNISIEINALKKLNINTSSFKELLNHYYLQFNDVKKIINYRDMHGDFVSVEQILQNNLIKPKQYRKIVPYLTID